MIIDVENNIEKLLDENAPMDALRGIQSLLISLGCEYCIERIQEIYASKPSCRDYITSEPECGEQYQMAMKMKVRDVADDYCIEKGILPKALGDNGPR